MGDIPLKPQKLGFFGPRSQNNHSFCAKFQIPPQKLNLILLNEKKNFILKTLDFRGYICAEVLFGQPHGMTNPTPAFPTSCHVYCITRSFQGLSVTFLGHANGWGLLGPGSGIQGPGLSLPAPGLGIPGPVLGPP